MIGWIIVIIGFLLIFYFVLTADNERSKEELNNSFTKLLNLVSKNMDNKKDSDPEFYEILEDLKDGKNPTQEFIDMKDKEPKNIFIIISDEYEVPEEIIEKRVKRILEHNPRVYTINNPERPNDKWFVVTP